MIFGYIWSTMQPSFTRGLQPLRAIFPIVQALRSQTSLPFVHPRRAKDQKPSPEIAIRQGSCLRSLLFPKPATLEVSLTTREKAVFLNQVVNPPKLNAVLEHLVVFSLASVWCRSIYSAFERESNRENERKRKQRHRRNHLTRRCSFFFPLEAPRST